jgi:putative toxin-antitoxin system antitoxin component (TIGR02293 family)
MPNSNRSDKKIKATPEVEVRIKARNADHYSQEIAFWAQLGIKANLRNDIETLELIRKGVKKPILNKMMTLLDISLEEMSMILHTSDRTLRRYQATDILNEEQSERLVEVAKVYSHVCEIFGTLSDAKIWMRSPSQALDLQAPFTYLDTSLGIKIVHGLVSRIQYGIYS